MEDDRPSVAHVDQEEAEEDALPDWTQFAKFAKTNGDKGLTGTTAVPFIPKRGEKDFEPLAASSAFPPSSNEATLSLHQQHMLQTSRNALYTALSSGSRQHSSRQHNSFTWRPELARATCDNGIATYGVHFGAIGHFHVERKRVELLPEEALYMNERGAIELWTETPEGARVPMSVQQAWAELIGHDELTPERYQVYAFLKRLGYTLVRARPIPGVEKPPPDRPFSLYYAVRDCLANYYSDLRRTVLRLLHSLHSIVTNVLAHRVRLVTTRAVGGREGRYASLVSGRRWANYDQLFSRLQIIPTGHDAPLARAPLAQTPSVLTPLVPSPTPSHTLSAPTTSVGGTRAKPLQDLEEFPYQPFYHMYKPISKYKKSSPPPPDFRIVIVNGSTTPMPTLFEFSDMFSSVPFPNEDTLLPPPPVQRAPGSGGPSAAKPVVARNNNNNNNKPKPPPVMSATSAAAAINVSSPRSPPPRPSLFETFVAKVAFVSTWFSQGVRQGGGGSGGANRSNNNNGNGNGGRPNKKSGGPPHSSGGGGKKKGGGGRPSPYPRLKTGRRSILVCVVTDGTSSILRFSETEFAKLPWKGQARSA